MVGVSFDWYLIGNSCLMAGTAENLLTAPQYTICRNDNVSVHMVSADFLEDIQTGQILHELPLDVAQCT